MRYWTSCWLRPQLLRKELRKLPECEQGCSLNFVLIEIDVSSVSLPKLFNNSGSEELVTSTKISSRNPTLEPLLLPFGSADLFQL